MIDLYLETKVVLAPSGELLLALPIYANSNTTIFKAEELRGFTGDDLFTLNVPVNTYEQMGFLLYHPEQEASFYVNSLELFEDLGKL